MANKLSQNIIKRARRLYPKALSYKGQLTNEQFCEIEKECDIDFYKLVGQDIGFTIRYKGGRKDMKRTTATLNTMLLAAIMLHIVEGAGVQEQGQSSRHATRDVSQRIYRRRRMGRGAEERRRRWR